MLDLGSKRLIPRENIGTIHLKYRMFMHARQRHMLHVLTFGRLHVRKISPAPLANFPLNQRIWIKLTYRRFPHCLGEHSHTRPIDLTGSLHLSGLRRGASSHVAMVDRLVANRTGVRYESRDGHNLSTCRLSQPTLTSKMHPSL